jgi:RHS repeat-associated protein
MINGSPTNLDTGHASYAYDAESSLYYCSARYYDPGTRQWTTADAAKADSEESAYQYCGGDEVNQSDPTGLDGGSFKVGHMGFLEFRLIHSKKSDGYLKKNSSYYVRNHHYGQLRAIDQYTDGSGTVTYTNHNYPAVSGDNKPADDAISNVGPIPGSGYSLNGAKGYYPFGFANGQYRGYETNSDTGYSPGGWRLDPFYTSAGVRGLFWVHGGINSSAYPHVTEGCIRLRTSDIAKLKGVWKKWSNKKQKSSCFVHVKYSGPSV